MELAPVFDMADGCGMLYVAAADLPHVEDLGRVGIAVSGGRIGSLDYVASTHAGME